MLRKIFLDLYSKLQSGYSQLQTSQKRYIPAFLFLIIFLGYKIIFGAEGSLWQSLLYTFLFFFGIAICSDLLTLYKKVYENLLVKAALLLLFSLCTNFVIAFSAQEVNDIVGVDPLKFPHTVALPTILNIPFLTSIGFFTLSRILLYMSPLLLVFLFLDKKELKFLLPDDVPPKHIPYPKITFAVQIISIIVFGYLMSGLWQNAELSYNAFRSNTASWFLYQWEMYPKGQCDVEPGTRVAFMSDDRILKGTKSSDGITFKLSECKSSGVPPISKLPTK
jgi:hypothetical protein